MQENHQNYCITHPRILNITSSMTRTKKKPIKQHLISKNILRKYLKKNVLENTDAYLIALLLCKYKIKRKQKPHAIMSQQYTQLKWQNRRHLTVTHESFVNNVAL